MNSTRRAIATWRGRMLLLRSYATTALINNTSASEVMNPIRSSIATWRDRALLSRSSSSSRISYYSSAALMINNDSESSSGSGSEGPSSPQAQPSESESESESEWPHEYRLSYQLRCISTHNAIQFVGYVDGPVLSGRCKFEDDYASVYNYLLEDREDEDFSDEEEFSDEEIYFYFARTIIKQDIATSDSPWLPVIFVGKLARVVASHLKDKDRVCVYGELVARHKDPRNYQGNVQVVVKYFEVVDDPSPYPRPSVSVDANLNFWRDLILNPKQWRDFRTAKLDGSVKMEHPDFKHKEIGHPLWVDTAPHWVHWVLPQLMPEHTDRSKEPKLLNNQTKPQKGHESWKDLLAHTGKWKDDKKKPNSPSFKHEDGEAPWLPGWGSLP